MKILLTGATGYIGKRLLPMLVEKGHHVVCCVRDKDRFNPPPSIRDKIEVIEVDLLDKSSLENIPNDIDGAYYLVHSMSVSADYEQLEKADALNRLQYEFHQKVMDGTLPLTIGGGIGQSRMCMLLLQKAHIGEVQVSLWDDETIENCDKKIKLL